MIKKNLANFFTLLNLLAGTYAIYFVFQEQYDTAFLLVLTGIALDFVDGLVARITKTSSQLGLQLDSLADLVTSGLAPSFFVFKIWNSFVPDSSVYFFALIIPVASAWRLAKFNLDTRQKEHFIGLPTPANALFLLSIGMIILKFPESIWTAWLLKPPVIYSVILFSILILNAPIPLISLKFNKNKKDLPLKIILVLVSLILILFLSHKAAPIILFLYLFLSFWYFKRK